MNKNKEIPVLGMAGLEGTEYSMLFTTNMSQKMDNLFGLNFDLSKMVRKVDDKIIYDILEVRQSPVRGMTGEITFPILKVVDYNFRSARCLMSAVNETERVVDYFSGLVRKTGQFFALPYDEVCRANNDIGSREIEEAIKAGYVRKGITTRVDRNPLEIIELTDKFRPLEKVMQGNFKLWTIKYLK